VRAAIGAGEVRRVVVARVARVGDTLHVRPALDLLAAALPGARVTFLASEYALAAARGAAAAEVVVWPKGRSPWAALARARTARALLAAGAVDLWLGLEDKPWGRRLAARLGARFFHADSTAGAHVVERKAGVLAPLGLWDGATPPPPVRWTPQPGARDRARERLAALPRPVVGLQVGSHAMLGLFAPRRRRDPQPAWVAEVGHALRGALGAGVVVHGGAGGAERRAARDAHARLTARGVPALLVEGLDLEGLGGVLGALDAYVSANTGPAHLAAACGTPVVLLEGPSTSAARPWRADKVDVINLGLPCSPCRGSAHGRACALPRCLDDVPPARVVAAVRGMLSGP
jgi:ADP-heptose:LPS heptosyltransferase